MKIKKISIIICVVIFLIIGVFIYLVIHDIIQGQNYEKEVAKARQEGLQEQLKELKKPPAVEMKKEVEKLIGYPKSNLEFLNQSETLKMGVSTFQVSKIVLDDKEENSEIINQNITKCLKANLKHCKPSTWEGKVLYANDALISLSFSNQDYGEFYCSFWKKTGKIVKSGEIVNFDSPKSMDTLHNSENLRNSEVKEIKNCTNFGIYNINVDKKFNLILCHLKGSNGPKEKYGNFTLKDFAE